MTDLQFVAISDDGKMIILQNSNGDWIEVPFDGSLKPPARPQFVAQTEDPEAREPLSPREIQAHIRAGISAEELAASSGTDLDRVRTFAEPIMLEREHMAQRAGRTIIRRASGAGPLADVVTARLEPLGVNPDTIDWDSFRREDGRWTIIVTYPSREGNREARWLFDSRNSALVPADDEARWLVGEVPQRSASGIAQVDPGLAPTVPYLVGLPSSREPHLPAVKESERDRTETDTRPTVPADVRTDAPAWRPMIDTTPKPAAPAVEPEAEVEDSTEDAVIVALPDLPVETPEPSAVDMADVIDEVAPELPTIVFDDVRGSVEYIEFDEPAVVESLFDAPVVAEVVVEETVIEVATVEEVTESEFAEPAAPTHYEETGPNPELAALVADLRGNQVAEDETPTDGALPRVEFEELPEIDDALWVDTTAVDEVDVVEIVEVVETVEVVDVVEADEAVDQAQPAVTEVEFEDEPEQRYTVEVKRPAKTPSWDEILFGTPANDSEPF